MIDQLKRNLVFQKLSYDIKNNLIEKEVYELGFTTRFSSRYLSRLLLSQYPDAILDFKNNNSVINGYLKEKNRFISINFIEYGFNFISCFKDNYYRLNQCSNFIKNYILENNLEREVDNLLISFELENIDDVLNYCIDNNIENASYEKYLFFYNEKSGLASIFEQYINTYINNNFNIKFRYIIRPVKEIYISITDKSILERLEYYDLLKNGNTYGSILESIINEPVIKVDDLIKKYSISNRTASYIFREYNIYNNHDKQMDEIYKMLSCHRKDDFDVIEEQYIQGYFLYSSSILSKLISEKLTNILFSEIMNKLKNGYYEEDIKNILRSKNVESNSNFKIAILQFNNYLNSLSSMDLKNIINKQQIIKKLVKNINCTNGRIEVELQPVKHFC